MHNLLQKHQTTQKFAHCAIIHAKSVKNTLYEQSALVFLQIGIAPIAHSGLANLEE